MSNYTISPILNTTGSLNISSAMQSVNQDSGGFYGISILAVIWFISFGFGSRKGAVAGFTFANLATAVFATLLAISSVVDVYFPALFTLLTAVGATLLYMRIQ